jgi:hypothetical protein
VSATSINIYPGSFPDLDRDTGFGQYVRRTLDIDTVWPGGVAELDTARPGVTLTTTRPAATTVTTWPDTLLEVR